MSEFGAATVQSAHSVIDGYRSYPDARQALQKLYESVGDTGEFGDAVMSEMGLYMPDQGIGSRQTGVFQDSFLNAERASLPMRFDQYGAVIESIAEQAIYYGHEATASPYAGIQVGMAIARAAGFIAQDRPRLPHQGIADQFLIAALVSDVASRIPQDFQTRSMTAFDGSKPTHLKKVALDVDTITRLRKLGKADNAQQEQITPDDRVAIEALRIVDHVFSSRFPKT